MLISFAQKTFGEKAVLQLKKLGYFSIFTAPLMFTTSLWLGHKFGVQNIAAWFTLFFIYCLVPFLDLIVGSEYIDPAKFADDLNLKKSKFYSLVLFLCIPLELSMIALGGFALFNYDLNLAGQLGVLLSVGFISGTLAVNVSHELVHRLDKKENWAGGLLLSIVCFGSFKIDHIMHHHVWSATPEDHLAARRGQTVFSYLAMSNIKRTISAWGIEAARLKAAGEKVFSFKNEMIYWYSFSAMWCLFFGLIFGPYGALYFIAQSMIAIAMMDVITYIEHYGLLRRKGKTGRYDRMTVNHSWNSNFFLTNLFLFNLPRHSDHHVYPNRKYQLLSHYEGSPELKFGYSTMMIIAMCPPLFFWMMHDKVDYYNKINGSYEQSLALR